MRYLDGNDRRIKYTDNGDIILERVHYIFAPVDWYKIDPTELKEGNSSTDYELAKYTQKHHPEMLEEVRNSVEFAGLTTKEANFKIHMHNNYYSDTFVIAITFFLPSEHATLFILKHGLRETPPLPN